ncbi:MAG: histidine kinase dimerization/phospho-acceptor domain-containing protein, partial [Phycisphaerae bacterium]
MGASIVSFPESVLVKAAQRRISAFLTAEEVPRWFGLSIVLIYLVGLGAISRFAITRVREEAAVRLEKTFDYAVAALVREIETIYAESASEATRGVATRIAAREFSQHFPVRSWRILRSDGRVESAYRPSEQGTIADVGGFQSLVAGSSGRVIEPDRSSGAALRRYRARIRLHDAASRADTTSGESGEAREAGTRMTERPRRPKPDDPGRARSEGAGDSADRPANSDGAPGSSDLAASSHPPQPTTLSESSDILVEVTLANPSVIEGASGKAGLLVVVFIVLGALFVVYRCLREQLRSVSRIAHRLRTEHERIEDDLTALRIEDETDAATESWNQLVELARSAVDDAERTEADRELARLLASSSGGELAEVLNALPDGLLFITEEDRIEYANAAICRLFGWSWEEVKHGRIGAVVAEGVGAKVLGVLRSTLQPEGHYQQHNELIQWDQGEGEEPDIFRTWIIPLHRKQRHGEALVVVRDISQQTRSEKAREDLIAQVTHELRTPLTNIRAYSETLSSGMFDDPKVITECYNVINKETRRLSRLIEDVLSVSQLEVGGIELELDQVDLASVLSDAVRDVRGLADEKNIDLQLLLPAKLEPIKADR